MLPGNITGNVLQKAESKIARIGWYLHDKQRIWIPTPTAKQVNTRSQPQTPVRREYNAWFLPDFSAQRDITIKNPYGKQQEDNDIIS